MPGRASSAVVALVLSCALAVGGEPEDVVRVGVILPDDSTAALAMRRGAVLAAEATGCEVRFEAPGTEGPWSGSAVKAVRLVYDSDVDALVAPEDRRLAHLAAQVATRSRTPLQVLSGADALTRVPVPWIRRVVPDERALLRALLETVDDESTLVVVTDPGAEGRRRAIRVAAAVSKSGRKRARVVTLDGRESARRAASSVAEADAVLMATGLAGTHDLLAELQRDRWTGTRLMGPQLDASRLATLAEGAIGGIAVRRFAPADGTGASRFATLYRRRFGTDAPWEAAATFDAVRRLVGRVTGTPPDSSNRTDRVRLARIGRAGRLDPLEPMQEAR
ncbi:MAG: ABC transporter substrate-binding protein [Planctomycetota bacterium]